MIRTAGAGQCAENRPGLQVRDNPRVLLRVELRAPAAQGTGEEKDLGAVAASQVLERQHRDALDATGRAPNPVRTAQKKPSNSGENNDGGNGGENLLLVGAGTSCAPLIDGVSVAQATTAG